LQRRLQIHRSLIKRLDLTSRLECHDGCVNSLSWNERGDTLLSGSDDLTLGIWHYPLGSGDITGGPIDGNVLRVPRATIRTGHHGNIFAGVFVPGTNDTKIISTAADGEIRLHDVTTAGSGRSPVSQLLYRSESLALKVEFHPCMPSVCLVTGQSGVVQVVDLRLPTSECVFDCVDLSSIGGTVGLACDPHSPGSFAVGTADAFVRLYDLRAQSLRSSDWRPNSGNRSECR
jgi:WD repeat-containing protein 42A